jgi:hypothetical protein
MKFPQTGVHTPPMIIWGFHMTNKNSPDTPGRTKNEQMKQKLLTRMFVAVLLVVSFSHGHASRNCTSGKQEIISKSILSAPAVHFGPLDIFKW